MIYKSQLLTRTAMSSIDHEWGGTIEKLQKRVFDSCITKDTYLPARIFPFFL
jgi:hypothetical protein